MYHIWNLLLIAVVPNPGRTSATIFGNSAPPQVDGVLSFGFDDIVNVTNPPVRSPGVSFFLTSDLSMGEPSFKWTRTLEANNINDLILAVDQSFRSTESTTVHQSGLTIYSAPTSKEAFDDNATSLRSKLGLRNLRVAATARATGVNSVGNIVATPTAPLEL